ncbi:MAG TPA: glycosyl transferase family 4 [Pseudohaliea sp.]|nr:glycosyl transferase family 4 [Pseudohaliea sp.]
MILVASAAVLLAVLAVAVYLRLARSRRWLAEPTARGAHAAPTPSGAGLALFAALAAALLLADAPPGPYALPLAVTFSLVLVGFVDDLRHLPAALRLAVYGAAALLGTGWLVTGAGAAGLLIWLPLAFTVLAFTNFYNFMDGIDGLAALQCVSAAGLAAWLGATAGASPGYLFLCLALAGVHAGFLLYNRPPARLFMGDAGSIPTGFLLAVLAVAGPWREGLSPVCWPILLALFTCDAGLTLLFRALRGAPLAQAHREHLYQRLARRWGSHGRVDGLFLAVQWLWLSPLAWLAAEVPALAWPLLALAHAPVIVAMVKYRHLQ